MNDVGDDSPNLERLLSLDLDRLIVCVGREEPQGLVSLIESLDCQISIERSHDDVSINGFKRAVYDEQVPRMNPRSGHRVTRHAHKERGSRMLDEMPVEIKLALDIVVSCKILEIDRTWLRKRDDGWWLVLPPARSRLKQTPREIPLNPAAYQALRSDFVHVDGRILQAMECAGFQYVLATIES